ncbi:MAG: hypothetical protein U0168_00445 [Nannocystaceae bacterium]
MADRHDEMRPLQSPYLDAFARAIEPGPGDAARVRRSLQRRLAAAAAQAPAVTRPRAAAAVVMVVKSTALSIGIAATALGSLHLAVRAWTPAPATLPAAPQPTPPPAAAAPRHAPAVAPVAAPIAAPAPVLPAPAAPAAAAPSRRVAAIRATAPAGAAATSAAAADDLRAELELIEPARTALARGDDRGARPWLERHAREHTAGVLQIERDGWLVVLDCRAGRSDAADRGRRFVLAHPRNGLRDDIITACALDREFGTDRATDSTPATE